MTFNEITEGAIREAFDHTRARSTSTSSTRSRRAASSTGSSATRSARSSGARSGAASRRGASSRWPCGWWSSASARSRPSAPGSTGPCEPPSRTSDGATFDADLVRVDGRPSTAAARPQTDAVAIGDEARGRRPGRELRRALRRGREGRHAATPAQPRRPSRPAPSSRRPAASSASAPSGRCRSPSASTRASRSTVGQVGLITYMRTDSTAIAGVAMGEARAVIGDRYGESYRCPRAASTRRSREGAQEAHESIRPTSFQRDPESMARFLKPEELRLYRLIWQRAVASQMAAKELRRRPSSSRRALRPAGERHPDPLRRLQPASTPRGATTTERTPRRRPPCRPWPRATGPTSAR